LFAVFESVFFVVLGLEVEEKLGPSNPFLEEVTPREAPVDIIMQSIQVPVQVPYLPWQFASKIN